MAVGRAGRLEGRKGRRLESWKVGRLKVGRLEGWKVKMLEGWTVGSCIQTLSVFKRFCRFCCFQTLLEKVGRLESWRVSILPFILLQILIITHTAENGIQNAQWSEDQKDKPVPTKSDFFSNYIEPF